MREPPEEEPAAAAPTSEPAPQLPAADAPGSPGTPGGDDPLPGDTLFEVPDGFWDEPALLPPDEGEATRAESVAEPAEAPGQPPLAEEAAPDSGLALVQKVFPGRVISQQPLLVAGAAEEPAADADSTDGDGLLPERDAPPD